MQHILVVEADDQTLRARGDELLLDGYEVQTAQTDRQARLKLAQGSVDAIVLGALESPTESLALLRELRAGEIVRADPRLPVVSIGADSDHAAVRHYSAGADIALPKSASPLLVAGALAAVSSRLQGEHERRRVLRVGSLEIDSDARSATIDDRPVRLTRIEFDLLQTFAHQPHTVLTRDQLAQDVWNTPFVSGRTIDTHVARLRSKLVDAGSEPLVQTVRGVGWRLTR